VFLLFYYFFYVQFTKQRMIEAGFIRTEVSRKRGLKAPGLLVLDLLKVVFVYI